jgi:RNA polymerase sigma-70 factor (ECF subfamily)
MDTGEFDAIVRDYRDRVVRYLASMLDDAALAHDLAQETFIRVHKSMDGLRDAEARASWIFRIARNVAIDHHRSRSGRQGSLTASLDEPDCGTDLIDAGVSVENKLDEAEMTACMHSTIRQLSAPLRECLILRDLEGLGEQAVADIQECSLAAVKVRTHRARQQLRAKLHVQCGFYQDERGVLRCEPVEPTNAKPKKGMPS